MLYCKFCTLIGFGHNLNSMGCDEIIRTLRNIRSEQYVYTSLSVYCLLLLRELYDIGCDVLTIITIISNIICKHSSSAVIMLQGIRSFIRVLVSLEPTWL